jgi:hypothetical protein
MATSYATPAELANWLPAEKLEEVGEGDADRLLARATDLIDSKVVFPYRVDDMTKLPVDAGVAAAMRDACCAQVEFWIEVGEENDIDGLAGTPVNVAGYSGRRPPTLGPRALQILRNAGLFAPYDGTVNW